jgi:hypothetical protein
MHNVRIVRQALIPAMASDQGSDRGCLIHLFLKTYTDTQIHACTYAYIHVHPPTSFGQKLLQGKRVWVFDTHVHTRTHTHTSYVQTPSHQGSVCGCSIHTYIHTRTHTHQLCPDSVAPGQRVWVFDTPWMRPLETAKQLQSITERNPALAGRKAQVLCAHAFPCIYAYM